MEFHAFWADVVVLFVFCLIGECGLLGFGTVVRVGYLPWIRVCGLILLVGLTCAQDLGLDC